MPLISSHGLLSRAAEQRTGVGAFNVLHLETAEALVAAAERAQLPVILQISENAAKYHGGLAPLGVACLRLAETTRADVVVHLDHAEHEDLVQEALDLGFTSVMFDGAWLPYEENVAATRRVVERARALGAAVEAELGEIGGKEGAHAPGVVTDPGEAAQFVRETGVDSLAVAVGSTHAMQERSAVLDLDRIAAIRQAVDVPLVLHGSSGVPDEMIVEGIRAGMTKINVSTHLNGFFTRAVKDFMTEHPSVTDSRKYMKAGREALSQEAERLLRLFAEAGASA